MLTYNFKQTKIIKFIIKIDLLIITVHPTITKIHQTKSFMRTFQLNPAIILSILILRIYFKIKLNKKA